MISGVNESTTNRVAGEPNKKASDHVAPEITEMIFRFVERSLVSAAVIIVGLALGTQIATQSSFSVAFEVRVGALVALGGLMLMTLNTVATFRQVRQRGVGKVALFATAIALLLLSAALVSATFRLQNGSLRVPSASRETRGTTK